MAATVLMANCFILPMGTQKSYAENTVSIVTTTFPIYDWAREIAGERIEEIDLQLLMDSGADLHNYQPVPADILKIIGSDLFIYVGGVSDDWVENVLDTAGNDDLNRIDLVEAMGDTIKMEEIVEGMEHDHEEDEEHDEHDENDHEENENDHLKEEADEHVWLSLRNAEKLVMVICEAMSEADPEGAKVYQANAAAYVEKLKELDARYTEAVEASSFRTVLFGDRFPFRYLADDYGLDYYAAFSGCSAEVEASFETIIFLAGKVDELGLPAVLTIENSDHKIAETVVETSSAKNAKILEMDSMQRTSAQDINEGTTYLGIMESNLAVLKEALN